VLITQRTPTQQNPPQQPEGMRDPFATERLAFNPRTAILILSALVLIGLCVVHLRPLEVLTEWAGLAHADSSVDTQPLRWLKSGDIAAVDRYYSSLQRKFEGGELTDAQLYGEFRKLYQDDPGNARYFDRWVHEYPSSYASRLAQGAYYYRMGWAVRGDAFIQQTSPLRLFVMYLYLNKATAMLQNSLSLSPRPYLSALHLLNIAMMRGTRQEARHWLDVGTSLDSNASLVRLRYLVTLEPRWGGSLEEMRGYVAECERAGVAAPTLVRLKWILAEEDVYANARNASAERRMQLFTELTLEARAAGADAPPLALAGLARIYWDQHRRAEADRLLAQIDAAHVDDSWTLAQMGYFYVNENRMPEAWQVLTKSAHLGDAWSQFAVGKTLVDGCDDIHLAPNRTAGMSWIRLAADQGFEEAIAYLEHTQ
jgi:hypothetical protein